MVPLGPVLGVGLGVFSGCSLCLIFYFLTLELQGILYIKAVDGPGPGRSRLLPLAVSALS